jgi:hypothetical protein
LKFDCVEEAEKHGLVVHEYIDIIGGVDGAHAAHVGGEVHESVNAAHHLIAEGRVAEVAYDDLKGGMGRKGRFERNTVNSSDAKALFEETFHNVGPDEAMSTSNENEFS